MTLVELEQKLWEERMSAHKCKDGRWALFDEHNGYTICYFPTLEALMRWQETH